MHLNSTRLLWRQLVGSGVGRRNFASPAETVVADDTVSGAPPISYWKKPKGPETSIRLYNCVARRYVPFVLANEDFVSWYTCGPTVYDSAHLGHASCYVKLDIMQRILRDYFNLNVVTAINITDIDDKLIARATESGEAWQELARRHEQEFWSDMRQLGVAEPNLKVRVTEHMPHIVAFIETLVDGGAAYVGADKSVYFAVDKLPLYGKLQNVSREAVAEGGADSGKRSAADFALWKAQKSADEPAWPSPWGPGRPGWHIECSALASMIFGRHVDVHAGGLDLRFPHHENEEAQSCTYHHTAQWVNYWLHTGQLSVAGATAKMSKSLKNTVSVSALLQRYTANEFRMACALSKYRNGMEYSDELMLTARHTLQKFSSFRQDCDAYLSGKKLAQSLEMGPILKNLHYAHAEVEASFCDDFDTARAISVLQDQISSVSRCINANVEASSAAVLQSATCLDDVAAVDNFVRNTLSVLGFAGTSDERSGVVGESDTTRPDLNALLEDILNTRKELRDRATAERNTELFRVCDELRDCLRRNGIAIRDHNQGSSWTLVGKSAKFSQ